MPKKCNLPDEVPYASFGKTTTFSQKEDLKSFKQNEPLCLHKDPPCSCLKSVKRKEN